ncbi:hypothetical protein LTR48_005614 [Friedmanniomyces endolithicus]|uniref:Uncharacterized protein n=1 Tax=Rachicladosporium monterosium TaxID=1507873 RepID=A0ABR0L1F2_9PEZI|nr:hypothetical protein LTR29_011921 [Friedmanniomyces endolithicus]KAK1091780.1 hypothetical protein LTR48_005614 [Friedmanniomyces endolithicus]KAK5142030.1 hypothetical protein LTR32_005542 [Rachicladosporium monterosium]
MSTNDTDDGNGTSPTSPRVSLVNGEHGMVKDESAEENTWDAAREIRQSATQAPPILSAGDLATLDHFFDAPENFVHPTPTTDAPTLRFSDAQTAMIRDFFETVEVIGARARARAQARSR